MEKVKYPYKKIYLEITNRCNLSCDFCIKNDRPIKDLSIEEFRFMLSKLQPYTKYLYFHILGEPLIHPQINDLINEASKNFYINITTNGYLLNYIQGNKNIRQLNISLHSFNDKYHVALIDYLDNIFTAVDKLIDNDTYISLRLWLNNVYSQEIIDYINKRYCCQVDLSKKSFKIREHLFINQFHEFIWPDLKNDWYQEEGSCYGLRDHFGILVDGTIVPCCLDTKGIINLGNIFTNNLDEILVSDRCELIRKGFCEKKKVEELCKHCYFLEENNDK